MRAPLALALLLPLAAAQATVGGPSPPPADTGYSGEPVVVPLYGHIYDLLQAVPMNTQPMIDLDLARGFGSPTVGGAGPLASPNSLRFYGSPGLVEYNLTEDGLPRHHPERGISFDVMLDPQPVVGHFFLGVKATDVPQAGQTGGPETGVAPALTVRMTMREGDDIGADLDSGEILAQGQATLDPTQWPVKGEPVEFVVDMGAPRKDRIPGDAAFNVKVEWFNAESPDGTQVTQRDWVVHTGARYPNRVEVATSLPLAFYSLKPTPLGADRISLHAVLNSPFGNYDVDTSSVQIAFEGPAQAKALGAPFVVQRSFEHNHHYEPVEVTWVWDYRAEDAPSGEYKVTVTAENLQKTATVTKTASFRIAPEGSAIGFDETGAEVTGVEQPPPRETPGVGLAPIAGLLGFLALRRPRT